MLLNVAVHADISLLRVVANDLRDIAEGDLELSRGVLYALAATLEDICEAAECGMATAEYQE